MKVLYLFPDLCILGWFWGDPHITTLDGLQYTFNGRGEYVLGRVSGEFEFQGRTDLVTNNASATVFSAIAVRGVLGSEVVEVSVQCAVTSISRSESLYTFDTTI